MADKDELAWKGAARPRRSGGFVDGVAMNEPTHALAVDPDGVAPARVERSSQRSGPQLELERMGESPPDKVRRSGRVRLTRS